MSGDAEYDKLVAALATAALGQADSTVGCVTFPYLLSPYDEVGALGIRNLAHAGVDLRARDAKVFAVHGGTIEAANLCLPGPIANQPRCTRINPKNDSEVRSTLVIEDETQSYKTFYLHMKEFDSSIKVGAKVSKGQRLGVSGDIGSAGSPHLHIEVRPNWSPQYCEATSAVSGSACRQEEARVMMNGPKTIAQKRTDYCTRDDLTRLTVDPAIMLARLAKAPAYATPKLLTVSPIYLRSVGPVRVGMTFDEAQRALGVPLDAEYSGGGNADARLSCGYAEPRYGPGGIRFMLNEGRVARIDVNSCRFATKSGVRVGDSELKVKAAYPGIEVGEHKYDPDGHYLSLRPKDPGDAGYWLLFETDGKKVTTFRVGREPEVLWVEGCF
jgi:hypothetical protein